MNSSVTYYSSSAGAFQQRCDYLWHRKFDKPAQKGILKERNAALVTYVTSHEMPFGGQAKVVEQTVMKVVLNMTNDTGADLMLLAIIVQEMQPNGFEVSLDDDTFEDEEAILVMWWNGRKLPSAHGQDNEQGEATDCIKVYADEADALEKVKEHFGSSPVYIYGEGPWLVAGAPITHEHAELLLNMKG